MAVQTLVVECAGPVKNKVLVALMALFTRSMITRVIIHVAHFMAGSAAFEAFIKHVVMTLHTAVMSCIADTGYFCRSCIGVAVAAFLRFLFYICRMVAGLAVFIRVFFVSRMVESKPSEFGMMALYTVAVVRKGIDMVTHIVPVKSLRVTGTAW